MTLKFTAFRTFARAIFQLDRKRQRYAREIIELALPARPQVAQHQRQAALHVQLASEINWTGPSAWRGNR